MDESLSLKSERKIFGITTQTLPALYCKFNIANSPQMWLVCEVCKKNITSPIQTKIIRNNK